VRARGDIALGRRTRRDGYARSVVRTLPRNPAAQAYVELWDAPRRALDERPPPGVKA
jgi:hypothetical protein